MNCTVPLLPLCYHVTRAVTAALNPKLDWVHNTSVQSNISELSTGLDCEPEAAPPHAPCRMSGHSPLGSRLSDLCVHLKGRHPWSWAFISAFRCPTAQLPSPTGLHTVRMPSATASWRCALDRSHLLIFESAARAHALACCSGTFRSAGKRPGECSFELANGGGALPENAAAAVCRCSTALWRHGAGTATWTPSRRSPTRWGLDPRR